jgi:signal transduction histidine kinase
MPEGGDLTIQGAADAAGNAVTLSLIDTGKGMSSETVAKIFKPFFSTRPGGTGLGLPTTRRIIEAHDGTIAVQSEPGKGTMFTIRLPAVAAKTSP